MDLFAVVYEKNVIVGPSRWNATKFKQAIFDECEVEVELPNTNNQKQLFSFPDDLFILSVSVADTPYHDPSFERLNGPFWEFVNDYVIMSFRVETIDVEASKSFLKEKISNSRKQREMEKVTVEINNIQYKFDTDKDTRNIIQTHISTKLQTVNWKIDRDTWLILTTTDLQNILHAIMQHIQSCFNWELSEIERINACDSIETLKNLGI